MGHPKFSKAVRGYYWKAGEKTYALGMGCATIGRAAGTEELQATLQAVVTALPDTAWTEIAKEMGL